MAHGRFEQQIEAVRVALADRGTPDARALLSKTVAGANGHLIGMVADAIDESDQALVSALPAAFERLLDDPIKRDPGCRGKVAIVRTLDRVDRPELEVFDRGVRHVQLEPVWGGRVDTAAELRGVCGMALVHARAPQAMAVVAVLLADPETRARIAAARALAASGDRAVAEPLLRLRVAMGDVEGEVLGECFAALLELVRVDALDDVAGYLRHADPAVADAAAIAIGGSRLPGAFERLRAADQSLVGEASRRARLLAMALVREATAWDYLLGVVQDGGAGAAEDAIAALRTFHHDEALMARAAAAVAKRRDAPVKLRLAALLSQQ